MEGMGKAATLTTVIVVVTCPRNLRAGKDRGSGVPASERAARATGTEKPLGNVIRAAKSSWLEPVPGGSQTTNSATAERTGEFINFEAPDFCNILQRAGNPPPCGTNGLPSCWHARPRPRGTCT